jgi:hypothetical protein
MTKLSLHLKWSERNLFWQPCRYAAQESYISLHAFGPGTSSSSIACAGFAVSTWRCLSGHWHRRALPPSCCCMWGFGWGSESGAGCSNHRGWERSSSALFNEVHAHRFTHSSLSAVCSLAWQDQLCSACSQVESACVDSAAALYPPQVLYFGLSSFLRLYCVYSLGCVPNCTHYDRTQRSWPVRAGS